MITLKARQQPEKQEETQESRYHGNQGKMCGENTEEGNTFKCGQASSTGTRQELAEPLPRAVSVEWQDRRLTAVGGWAHRGEAAGRRGGRTRKPAGRVYSY